MSSGGEKANVRPSILPSDRPSVNRNLSVRPASVILSVHHPLQHRQSNELKITLRVVGKAGLFACVLFLSDGLPEDLQVGRPPPRTRGESRRPVCLIAASSLPDRCETNLAFREASAYKTLQLKKGSITRLVWKEAFLPWMCTKATCDGSMGAPPLSM